MFSKLRIIGFKKTHNPKIRKIIVKSDDEEEDAFLETLDNELIGKYLPITSKTSQMASINNFFPELVINSTINHPFCNSSIGVINDQNNVILLFEKLNCDLVQYQNANKSFSIIKQRIKELVIAVKYLHSKRILHGNINDKNILFDKTGTLKLSDYEQSSFIISGDKNVFETKTYQENYRAPEVWNNDEWGFSADIWALGCVIYKMIYKEDLFPLQEDDESYKASLESWHKREKSDLTENFRISEKWSKQIHSQINNLILRMCNPKEENRPSIFDIYKQLEEDSDYTIPISCSPNSICDYIEIVKCEEIINCSYNEEKFLLPAKIQLKPLLCDMSREYASLVLLIYDILNFKPEFDSETYEMSVIISDKLLRKKSNIQIRSYHISRIKDYLNSAMYTFFDWKKYYGSRY